MKEKVSDGPRKPILSGEETKREREKGKGTYLVRSVDELVEPTWEFREPHWRILEKRATRL